jgi:glycosyltransferase involved in cell wall biosynthesis/peptidoglycan/xylan/chitin deacetylase (PgdA/CDA1 family)
MKVLFFINELSCGGKERRLTELIKALYHRSECEFELAIMSNRIYYKEVLDLNIHIHYIIRKTKKDLSVFRMFYELCKNYKPDIVHCWDSMTAIYSVPVCKLLKIKLVNGLITNSPERQNVLNKHWLRAKITFPFSDLIIGNSNAGLIAYSAPKNKSYVIHNGFNFERTDKIIEQSSIREQLNINTKYIIGMVASNTILKDYKTYFAAAHILLQKRKDVTFLAIGENTDSVELQRKINSEYTGFFRLLGKRFGIESYINALNIGVLSTFTEGISNSILEYMAVAKPVVATSGGGTNEIVIDQVTGFLIDKSNPQKLAEKLELLLNSPELRIKMGTAGKERINNFFTIDSMTNNFISHYNELISEKIYRKINFITKFLRESLAIILIQIYHISRPKSNGILSVYFHNPSKELFEKILKWLQKKQYKFLSVDELDTLIKKKLNTEKHVFISFDDGWKGNVELVESINKYKVPVAIFVTTDALVDGNYWWEYSLIKDQRKYSGIKKVEEFKKLHEIEFKEKVATLKHNYCLKRSCMTLEELVKLSKNEFITIGSHTVSHPILIRCSDETQIRELAESKKLLSQILNKDIDYLAFPNGDYNSATLKFTKQCGYKLAFTTNPGRIDVKNVDPYIIPRNALYDSGGYYENISKILGIWQKFIFLNK